MIILTNTTDSLEVVTGAAATIDVQASWVDSPTPIASSSSVTPGRTNTAITTATTTTVVAAPASSTVRNIKEMTIRNKGASLNCDVTVQYDQNGTNFEMHKVTLRPGDLLEYIEGVGWFTVQSSSLTDLYKILSADDAGGQNVATVQPWFPTAGAVSVEASTTYFFKGLLFITRAAGTTSHTTGIGFGGTATLTSILWRSESKSGDTTATGADNAVHNNAAAVVQLKPASTSATENALFEVEGIVRINAAGTFIPQFQYSAAPGGAPTVKANTFFRMNKLGGGGLTVSGTWS